MNHFNLMGLRVLNTRPLEQGELLTRKIKRMGGEVFICPALTIMPVSTSWVDQLPNLQSVNHAIFVSANAVNHGIPTVLQHQPDWPKNIKVTAIGHATKRALLQRNLSVDYLPEKANSEHLLALPHLQDIKNQVILLFKGEGGLDLIANTLNQREAQIIELSVYRRQLPTINQENLERCWRDQLVDIILYTSQQAMHNLFFLFGEQAHPWLKQTPSLVISERLVNEARLLGIQTILCCEPEQILEKLYRFRQGLSYELEC